MIRLLLLFAYAIILTSSPVDAQQSKKEPADCIGNYKCEHEKFHKGYKEMWKQFTKCSCNNGYCRPSKMLSWFESPTKYAVLVDGCWYPVPKEVVVRSYEMNPTTRALLFSTGAIIHVCAIQDPTSGVPPIHPWREGKKNIAEYGFQCTEAVIECVAESGGM